MKILILGGTTEASALARALVGDGRFHPMMSLAGRTLHPRAQPIPCRTGGFGGAAGLADHLQAHGVKALVDATHPFAGQMTRHAAEAARLAAVPLLVVSRPRWTPEPGDRWTEVHDMQAAAHALGPTRRRVLLTIGQLELAPFAAAPWHHYLIRSIDPPSPDRLPPHCTVITASGPFAEADERRLMEAHGIQVLITKNSGGTATRPKLAAARTLGLEVIMVARPALPAGIETVASAAEAMAWLERQHAATLRGV